MAEELEALRGTVMQSLSKCAENSILFLGDDRMATLSKLKEHVAAYCTLDVQQKVATDALAAAKTEIDRENIDALDDKFKEHLQNMVDRECNTNTHTYMQQFNSSVSKALEKKYAQENNDDSDIALTQTNDQHIDPITKKQIEDPVKNKRCGHIYEKKSIMEILKTRKLRCPVAGCGDKNPIAASDLIADDELRFRMTLTHHSTPARVSNRSTIDVHDQSTIYEEL